MRVVVTVESRYTRTPDGAVWTTEGPAASFFARYQSAFDRVRVVARVADVPAPDADAQRVDGDGIDVWPVPYYIGPAQYIARRAAIVTAVRSAAVHDDAVIVRAPTPIGTHLADARRRAGLPFAVEVIGDPYDVFAPGAINHPLRPMLRWRQTTVLRKLCLDAVAVAYVTEKHLQSRYPAASSAVTAAYSNVHLPVNAYVPEPRAAHRGSATPTIVSIGSLEVPYKGIDMLIKAIHQLHALNLPARLVHVGDGRLRPQYERLADQLGVAKHVCFTGKLAAGDAVRRQLDAADLMVVPSLAEGLPRALIEGMARGLPAVGSAVGGIPELLTPAELIAPGDVRGMVAVLRSILADPQRMAAASARNLDRAGAFSADRLSARQASFYLALRDLTRREGAVTSRSV